MKIIRFVLIEILALSCIACVTKPLNYTNFIQSDPISILIMPPINKSNNIKAPASIMVNTLYALSEQGYYVLPPSLVMETFKENGIVDGSQASEIPLKKLRDIFGVDAVLYTTIQEYGQKFMLFDSVHIVSVNVNLVDASTGKLLWNRIADIRFSTTSGTNDAAVKLLAATTAQITAKSGNDEFEQTRIATDYIYTDYEWNPFELKWTKYKNDCRTCLPHGKYSPDYWKKRAGYYKQLSKERIEIDKEEKK